ncbi:MAG TPA: hypothetical protein VFF73_34300 [Planctomycetota bacterium]|nr:hypothetical protein [Planctomycetota bacterium]
MSWLDGIEVATPCQASWEKMEGDDRVRFCGLCKLNVYNLSGMSRDEAERLVRSAEGRLCVKLMRRSDGTVLTEDCPVGLAARLRRRTLAVASWFLAFVGLGALASAILLEERPMKLPPLSREMGKVRCPTK